LCYSAFRTDDGSVFCYRVVMRTGDKCGCWVSVLRTMNMKNTFRRNVLLPSSPTGDFLGLHYHCENGGIMFPLERRWTSTRLYTITSQKMKDFSVTNLLRKICWSFTCSCCGHVSRGGTDLFMAILWWGQNYTNSWSWTIPKKRPIVQLLKNFPSFYGTRRFITALTRALHWCLSWARSIQPMPSHSVSLWSI
jgi:hypothetical protein